MNKQIYGPLHYKIVEEQKLLYYKRKFYSDYKDFNSFENITDDIIEKINIKIKILFSETEYPKKSKKCYYGVMKYLISPKGHKDFPTFDEKIVFLIKAIDPELSIYYYHLSNGYSLKDEEYLRNKRADNLINFIENSAGLFDGNILKYEELYFRKFLKVSDIISFVNCDYSTKFFESFNDIHSFSDISSFQIDFFSKKAEYYITHCKDYKNPNTLCFNMSNPNSILELWHPLYRAIFFILVIDPELKALQIYNQECQMAKITARIFQEFGFFHQNFIKIEELYRRKFYPGMNFTEWNLK